MRRTSQNAEKGRQVELFRFVQDHGSEISILLGALRLIVDIVRGLRGVWRRSRSRDEDAPSALASVSGSRRLRDSGSLARCEDDNSAPLRPQLCWSEGLQRTVLDWSVSLPSSIAGPSLGRPRGTDDGH